MLERHVAPEAAADRSHRRIEQIVVGPVRRSAVAHGGIQWRARVGALEQRILGVVEILLAQFFANLAETEHRQESRLLVPLSFLEQASDAIDQSVSHATYAPRYTNGGGLKTDMICATIASRDGKRDSS